MKPKEFDKIAKELLASVLGPLGFSCKRSITATFHREVSPGCFHVILPDLGSRGMWYDVKVFPFASVLDPLFEKHFPDWIGIPTDIFCYLSARGVNADQTTFDCETEANFRRQFDLTVSRLLLTVAVPYLEQFTTLSDMLPFIRNPLQRAIATHFVGGRTAAHELLKQQQLVMEGLDAGDEIVAAMKSFIDELLEAHGKGTAAP